MDEVTPSLENLDAKVDRLAHKIDAGFEKLNDKIDASHQELVRYFNKIYYIFMFLTAIIGGLLALLAKVIGVF